MGIGKNLLSILRKVGTDVQFTAEAPLLESVPQNLPLLNVASQNMAIDALSADVDFIRAPTANQLMLVSSIPLVLIENAGVMAPQNFAALAAPLAKGFQLIVKRNGVDKIICTIKTNKDLTTCFFGGVLGSGLPSESGFFDTAKYVTGSYTFLKPIPLDGSKGDQFIMRMRDNLDPIAHFEASVAFAVIPL